MTGKSGGSAFPVNDTYHGGLGNIERGEPGMTLRDYFAAKAMYAIIGMDSGEYNPAIVAESAYLMADAMLKERAKYREGEA